MRVIQIQIIQPDYDSRAQTTITNRSLSTIIKFVPFFFFLSVAYLAVASTFIVLHTRNSTLSIFGSVSFSCFVFLFVASRHYDVSSCVAVCSTCTRTITLTLTRIATMVTRLTY